jgi:aspartate/methionine/tyrosine aminotransferase
MMERHASPNRHNRLSIFMDDTQALRLSRRARDIQPFQVMNILARARAMEAAGRSIVHMEIGEPDFATPQPIVAAGIRALQEGHTHYTPALGLAELREAISAYYRKRYGVEVSPAHIVITPGASGALQLVLALLLNPGDQVLLTDPGYPCNRHLVHLTGGEAVVLNVSAETDYQPTAAQVAAAWSSQVAAVLLASPANPTGTLIAPAVLEEICSLVADRHGCLIVDEIYHGLVYEHEQARSALTFSDQVFVVNSFSKYFGMTGWRLGWLVVPEQYVSQADKLAQNLFLAASTPAQYAALAAFEDETIAILEDRRREFAQRRDYLLAALRNLGFVVPVTPGGAFYVYADCRRFTADSFGFAAAILEQAGVAVTPGSDFGSNLAEHYLRFAYTTSLTNLEEGVRRLAEFLRIY